MWMSHDSTACESVRCTDSLTEFVARLWLEGEVWWDLHVEPAAALEVANYEREWRQRHA
jgi:hypothetical protein